jgi:hypothetical protein
MHLAETSRIDPDRVSFVKVLKHARRSVLRQNADTPGKTKKLSRIFVRPGCLT